MHQDQAEYAHFCGPLRISKAIQTVHGLLHGLSADRTANAEELRSLHQWLEEQKDLAAKPPLDELVAAVEKALADKKLTKDEIEDMHWLCEQFGEQSEAFAGIRSGIQELHGVLAGIAADQHIAVEELESLRSWMQQSQQLRKTWPYTELEAIVGHVLQDGWIDEAEHKLLLGFLQQFQPGNKESVISRESPGSLTLSGVCAVQPEIEFLGTTFCFTGSSARASREDFERLVCEHGAAFSNTITRDVNYLIVGAGGNPCWAFSCYGRKVEKAMKLRRDGFPILIIHENDFWDTL